MASFPVEFSSVKLTACIGVTFVTVDKSKITTTSVHPGHHRLISSAVSILSEMHTLAHRRRTVYMCFRVSLFWTTAVCPNMIIIKRACSSGVGAAVAVTHSESAYVTIARWLVHHVETQMKR